MILIAKTKVKIPYEYCFQKTYRSEIEIYLTKDFGTKEWFIIEVETKSTALISGIESEILYKFTGLILSCSEFSVNPTKDGFFERKLHSRPIKLKRVLKVIEILKENKFNWVISKKELKIKLVIEELK